MTLARRTAALLVLWAGGGACGGSEVARPLEIEIDGLSARAQTLVLKVFEDGTGRRCQGVTLESAPALVSEHAAVWERSSEAERRLTLPKVEQEGITIIAYALDVGGRPIQFVCSALSYEDIGELALGVLVLRLSDRVT